jgi:hypothetical protein
MNWSLWLSIVWVVFLIALYIAGRKYIPGLAEKKRFFLSPKVGRIMARCRSGRIIGFLDNLVGSRKHTNPETGVIEKDEVPPNGFFWELFGAYFVFFDTAYQYTLAKSAEEKEDGTLKYEEIEVESIFLKGMYPITTLPITKDGVRLKVKIQIDTETIDAASALSLPVSWTIKIFTFILGETRTLFGSKSVEDLITKKGFDPTKVDDFETQVIARNHRIKDSGQQITGVTIVDIDFADPEIKRAYSAPFVASKEAQQQVANAKAFAEAATNKAKGIREEEKARSATYKSKVASFGGNSLAAAIVIAAENGQGIRTLATGNQSTTVPLGNGDDK